MKGEARGSTVTAAQQAAPIFLLGTHQPGWLATSTVPLFVSDRRLRTYCRLPRAAVPWALDSGAFSELALHGSWAHGPTPQQYVARIRRYRREIGKLLWAAPQDWMCEPWIIARTGLSVAEHQARTVVNFRILRQLAPGLPIIPVVQGWAAPDDYLRCVELYRAVGIDLATEPLVGVGSVCRRQASADVELILRSLHTRGVRRLHGFGIKMAGVRRYRHLLTSADSMAWSMAARYSPRLPSCTRHTTCANCPRFALRWRRRLLAATHGCVKRARRLHSNVNGGHKYGTRTERRYNRGRSPRAASTDFARRASHTGQ